MTRLRITTLKSIRSIVFRFGRCFRRVVGSRTFWWSCGCGGFYCCCCGRLWCRGRSGGGRRSCCRSCRSGRGSGRSGGSRSGSGCRASGRCGCGGSGDDSYLDMNHHFDIISVCVRDRQSPVAGITLDRRWNQQTSVREHDVGGIRRVLY